MKQLTFSLIALFLITNIYGQVGINTVTPDPSSALDINSVSGGVLPPRMTTVQRDAIQVTLSSAGIIIYNTSSNRINIFDGTTWHNIINTSTSIYCTSETTFSGLLSCIQSSFTPAGTLGYSTARDILYSEIDVDLTTNKLKGIYTDFTILMDYSTNPDPSIHAFNLGINAEHVYPQSMGAMNEPGKSDLHNLFPAKANVNSSRSSCPFAEINNSDSETWYYLEQSMSTIPTSDIDKYSEKDNDANYPLLNNQGSFEPRESKKGDIARAVFYFYTIYNSINTNAYTAYANDDFFNYMKTDLLQWHIQDPVDQAEIERNNEIKTYQGNDNPFILDPTLALRLFN
jgi:endonuclease I